MDKSSATYKRNEARQRRRKAIQKKLFGTTERPRLVVYRSLSHIQAQIVNDENGITLVAYSTYSKDGKIDRSKKKTEQSFEVGKVLGEMAKAKGITKVCFDRGGYLYHGRVKALADGARKAGLEF
ncbi:MAG TPA: 50S ribosomal protein L18 [Candidatus Cloacimonadota bacterium]|nr:50S ribosomal protein L18 [Candidatus Cloacimonadota bacterium]